MLVLQGRGGWGRRPASFGGYLLCCCPLSGAVTWPCLWSFLERLSEGHPQAIPSGWVAALWSLGRAGASWSGLGQVSLKEVDSALSWRSDPCCCLAGENSEWVCSCSFLSAAPGSLWGRAGLAGALGSREWRRGGWTRGLCVV